MANNDCNDNQDEQVNKICELFNNLAMSQKEQCAKKMITDIASENPDVAKDIIGNVENVFKLKKEYDQAETLFKRQRDESKAKLHDIIEDLDSTMQNVQKVKAASNTSRLLGNVLIVGGHVVSYLGYPSGQMACNAGNYFETGGLVGTSAMTFCEVGIEIWKQLNIQVEIIDKYERARKVLTEKGGKLIESYDSFNSSLESLSRSQSVIIATILALPLNLPIKRGINFITGKDNFTVVPEKTDIRSIIAYSAFNIGLSCWNLYEFKKSLENGHFSKAAEELRRIHDSM